MNVSRLRSVSPHRLPLWRAVVMASGALVLAACASAPGPSQDLKTDSDRSELDRRAAVRVELAGGYMARGQYATALDEIKLALQLRPDMREAINLRNLVYAAMGETTLAEEGFRRAMATAPQDGDAMHNYAWFLCQQQRWAPSFAVFDQVAGLTNYRSMGRTLLARGVCEARAGDFTKAERSLSRAFELEPGNPAIALNLAEVLLRRKDLERARFYARRVNASPEQINAQSLWLALRIERELRNTAGMEELSQQLRQRYPDAPETQRLKEGRFDE